MNFVGFGRDFSFFQEYGVGGVSFLVTLELGKSLATSSFFWPPRISNSSRPPELIVGSVILIPVRNVFLEFVYLRPSKFGRVFFFKFGSSP